MQVWVLSFAPQFSSIGSDLQFSASVIQSWSNINRSPRMPHSQWMPPHAGKLKWNVDGSSLGKPGRAGVGGVLRGPDGCIKCLFSCSAGICESNEAELKAIEQALVLTAGCQNLVNADIMVETDSLNAYKWVMKRADFPWKLAQLANSIGLSQLRINNLSFNHIRRSANEIADVLAKEGTARESNYIIWF